MTDGRLELVERDGVLKLDELVKHGAPLVANDLGAARDSGACNDCVSIKRDQGDLPLRQLGATPDCVREPSVVTNQALVLIDVAEIYEHTLPLAKALGSGGSTMLDSRGCERVTRFSDSVRTPLARYLFGCHSNRALAQSTPVNRCQGLRLRAFRAEKRIRRGYGAICPPDQGTAATVSSLIVGHC